MSRVMMGLIVVAAGLAADGPKAGDVRSQYEALIKDYEADLKTWEARFATAGGTDKVDWMARHREWPGWAFAPRILGLAEAHPDDPAAVDALLWVVKLRDNVGAQDREVFPHFERALALLRDHLKDPRVGPETLRTIGRAVTPGSETFLLGALEQGRDRDTRGCACLALAELLALRREIALNPWFDHPKAPFSRYVVDRLDPRFVLYVRTADPAALSEEAARLYTRANQEFGDVVARPPNWTIGAIAKDGLVDLLSYSVGRVFPQIEGPDASVGRLSLRDFRGKVVVLVLTNPKATVLHRELRDLLARHRDEPFAVLSMMFGVNKADLDAAIKAGDVTWPCWWFDMNGPNLPNVSGQSPVILDAEGVIRARGGRVEDLEETIDRLLGEMKARP